MKNIAIITARSGSKGLPDKNIRPLAGIPLIAYTIKAALESGMFDTVMVSTDSEKYAEISRSYGAEVPFLRSAETSGDTAGSWDVVREVLKNYKAMGKEFDKVCLLQPTSPLRDAQDIIGAFRRMEEIGAENITSLVEVDHPIQWCIEENENFSMAAFAASPGWKRRRQDLPKHYRLAGVLYIVNAQRIMDPDYAYVADNCYGYVVPKEKSLDVDSLLDFLICEAVLKHRAEFEDLNG